eukprot:jgi/Pico_ML_1/50797/g1941.t1
MQERVGRKVQLYGDAAYPECDVLYSAPKGNNISLEVASFAKTMSSYRESVEWVFGKLGEQQQHPTVLDKSLAMAAAAVAAATPHRSGQVTGHGSSSNTPPFWTRYWPWQQQQQQQQQHPTVLDKVLAMAAATTTPHRSGQVTGHGSSSNTPPFWTSHWPWQQQQHPTVLDKSLAMAAAAAATTTTPHRSGQVTVHGSSSNFVVQQL